MPKAVEYELRCVEEKIRVGNHSEILIGYRVDFAMVVPMDDCYIDIYELPKERFVHYDQWDGPWLEYFGKAKVVGRSDILNVYQSIDLFQFLGIVAQGVVSECLAWKHRDSLAVLFRGGIVNPSAEVIRLANEIQAKLQVRSKSSNS